MKYGNIHIIYHLEFKYKATKLQFNTSEEVMDYCFEKWNGSRLVYSRNIRHLPTQSINMLYDVIQNYTKDYLVDNVCWQDAEPFNSSVTLETNEFIFKINISK